jgi:5-hydroxyisourate hydrolase-like protein (transthyretin family)
MRRSLAVLLVALVAGSLLTAIGGPSQGLVTPLAGRIFDYRTDLPVAGVRVEMVAHAAGEPGPVVGSAETDSDGRFSITPEVDPGGEVWVRVVGDRRVQGGYVGGPAAEHPNWVQSDISSADTYPATASLGRVNSLPSYVRGTVVNAANGDPVRNLRVSLRDAVDHTSVIGSDITDRQGRFRIDGIEGEDFGLRFVGRDRGFETGWLACNGKVVRTWGAACGVGPGGVGRVRIDRL